MQIADTVAVVTGAASGLGLATARALINAGASVAMLDRDAQRLGEQARAAGGLGLACDVIDSKSAESAVAMVCEQLGSPRILVNCAGIAPAGLIVGRDGAPLPLAGFEKVIAVNLIGSFNLMRLVAAAMSAADPLADGERGVIVNTASVAAYDGQIGQAAYAASKGGIAALTLPAARELARHGIRVLAIAPGIFATPMLDGLPDKVQASLSAAVPFPPRLGRPDEFADLALHMITNSMLNGEVVRLDGAIRMAPR